MITRRDRTAAEFAVYLLGVVEKYARDLGDNHGYSLSVGRDNAARIMHDYLPDGHETVDHRLWCIVRDAELVGYLWVSLRDRPQAYICDFSILPPWRRRGYGRAALTALDSELAAAGCTEVALRVAANNPHARALYESNAFHLTGYTMAASWYSNKKPARSGHLRLIALTCAARCQLRRAYDGATRVHCKPVGPREA